MKVIVLLLSLLLLFVVGIHAHTWVLCTDYGGVPYNNGRNCYSGARRTSAYPYFGTVKTDCTDLSKYECNVCQKATYYPGTPGVAQARPGQRLNVTFPCNNHCGLAIHYNINHEPVFIYRSVWGEAGYTTKTFNDWQALGNISYVEYGPNQFSDYALLEGENSTQPNMMNSIELRIDPAWGEGMHYFLWAWKIGSNEYYTSCFDVYVSSSGGPPPASATASTGASTVTTGNNQGSSTTGNTNPTTSNNQNPTTSNNQNPTTSNNQNPTTSNNQNPTTSNNNPTTSNNQNPTTSNNQNPTSNPTNRPTSPGIPNEEDSHASTLKAVMGLFVALIFIALL